MKYFCASVHTVYILISALGKYDGGGERKSKDIIFGSCVQLWDVIMEPVYFLGYEFIVMAVSGAVCAFH